MYISPVDGRYHVSKTDDLNQLPDGTLYKTDDPYPDPKFYAQPSSEGAGPMPDATQAQMNDVVNQWPHVLNALYSLTKAVSAAMPIDKDAADARTEVNAIDPNRFTFK